MESERIERRVLRSWIVALGLLVALVSGVPGDTGADAGDLKSLSRDLRAPRPETRRAAVKKLAQVGTRDAFGLVLGALGDMDPMVADEAEVELATARDGHVIAQIEGRDGLGSRDAWVRLRAAEALGRVEVVLDPRPLFAAVAPGDVELSRTSLWSIERLARAKHLGGEASAVARTLDGLAGSQLAAEVRAAALFALERVDATVAKDRAIAALKARDPELRCAGLAVAAGFPEQEALTAAQKLLDDEAVSVRVQAIENLEKLRSRQSVLALLGRLEKEERTRLRYEILRFLRAASGEDHGFDLAAWRAWAATIQGPWTTGDAQAPRTSTPLGDTHVAFAGLTVLSDRVVFLIDLSGSMWQTKVGDATRKEIVDAKLRAVLEALPATSEFNVIPYTNSPLAWEKRLVRADASNVKRALDAFEHEHRSGKGNFFDAALLALDDPRVDTIVTLTDGVPTGGHRWNLRLMVELLVEIDRCRKVAFDSILVDAPKGHRVLWADLAARTGGRSIAVELEPKSGGTAR